METKSGISSGENGASSDRLNRLRNSLDMLKELRELVAFIHQAKSEIASIRPDEIKSQHLSVASDEMDAIVLATEEATNEIMEAAEEIESVGERISEADRDTLNDAVTRIYQACSFQDITGQRISKVVGALKHIEARVETMVGLLGGKDSALHKASNGAAAEPAVKDQDPDAKLLNGPQLPGKSTSQDEIDALFG